MGSDSKNPEGGKSIADRKNRIYKFPFYFLCLDTKKVTKERSRLQIILGFLFFVLPTQYNSRHLVPLGVTQTVLLTKRHRSKPQNSRLTPKFSKAT